MSKPIYRQRTRKAHWHFASGACVTASEEDAIPVSMDDWNEVRLVLAVQRRQPDGGGASARLRPLHRLKALEERLFERLPAGAWRTRRWRSPETSRAVIVVCADA
jgi:hypothetical protein